MSFLAQYVFHCSVKSLLIILEVLPVFIGFLIFFWRQVIDPCCKVHRVSPFVAIQIVPDSIVKVFHHIIDVQAL